MFAIDFDFRVNGEKFPVDTIEQLDAFLGHITVLRTYLKPIAGPTTVVKTPSVKRYTFPILRGALHANPPIGERTIDYVVDALAKSKKPLHAKELTSLIIEAGWVSSSGSPMTTVASIIRRPTYAKYVKVNNGAISLTDEGRKHSFSLSMGRHRTQEQEIQESMFDPVIGPLNGSV